MCVYRVTNKQKKTSNVVPTGLSKPHPRRPYPPRRSLPRPHTLNVFQFKIVKKKSSGDWRAPHPAILSLPYFQFSYTRLFLVLCEREKNKIVVTFPKFPGPSPPPPLLCTASKTKNPPRRRSAREGSEPARIGALGCCGTAVDHCGQIQNFTQCENHLCRNKLEKKQAEAEKKN